MNKRLKPTRQYENRNKPNLLITAHCFSCQANTKFEISPIEMCKYKDTFYDGYCIKCKDITKFKIL